MNTIYTLKRAIDGVTVLSLLAILLIPSLSSLLWSISLISVFLLMCIRPLDDLFPNVGFIRLMPLRKNLGILSASIVVGFGLIHYISLGSAFFSTYFSLSYWTFKGNLFWGHLGELTGFILLITSNKFSMRLLKRNWKRVQRLSYVYFVSGAWFVFSTFGKIFGLIALIVVVELTMFAFLKNRVLVDSPEPEVS